MNELHTKPLSSITPLITTYSKPRFSFVEIFLLSLFKIETPSEITCDYWKLSENVCMCIVSKCYNSIRMCIVFWRIVSKLHHLRMPIKPRTNCKTMRKQKKWCNNIPAKTNHIFLLAIIFICAVYGNNHKYYTAVAQWDRPLSIVLFFFSSCYLRQTSNMRKSAVNNKLGKFSGLARWRKETITMKLQTNRKYYRTNIWNNIKNSMKKNRWT